MIYILIIAALLIINITNDAWFGKNQGPYQHYYNSILRAQEYDTSLVSLAVWAGQEPGKLGETPEVINRWKNLHDKIWLVIQNFKFHELYLK